MEGINTTSLERIRNIVISVSNIIRRLFRRQKETVAPEAIQRAVKMFQAKDND